MPVEKETVLAAQAYTLMYSRYQLPIQSVMNHLYRYDSSDSIWSDFITGVHRVPQDRFGTK